MKRALLYWVCLLLLSWFITYVWVEISGVFYGVLKAYTALLILYGIDEYVLTGIDTAYEIRNGNIAYALILLGISFIVGITISAS